MKPQNSHYLCLLALVAALTLAAHAQTFSVIHTFTGIGGDGAGPAAGVTLRAGTLYGTTQIGGRGGVNGPGTVYQITHVGSTWIYTPIFLFPADKSGGANPQARVVVGPDGHLYGTTTIGGSYQAGVVFNLTPPLSICKTADCSWKENVLWSFGNGVDGANPGSGDLTWVSQTSMYGTTVNGGDLNDGVFYALTKSGNNWTETLPLVFAYDRDNCPAVTPWSGVTAAESSVGTTLHAGFNGAGTAWEQGGENGLTCLVQFGTNGPNGAYPYAGLALDANNGNLYGAASDLGTNGGGTVFELVPNGPGYTFNLLYSLVGTPNAQCGPRANLTLDAAGNLYGTTFCDGAHHLGNVFKLTKVGDAWVYSSLHDFAGAQDGAYPLSNVTIASDGTLYGTTSSGGASGDGVVWMITP